MTSMVNTIEEFEAYLYEEERSHATIEKYLRDVRKFYCFLQGRNPERARVLEYKTALLERYTITSANSMLAALNTYLRFCGMGDLCVRQYKVQRQAYCSETKELSREEYLRLVNTAKRAGKERLSLVLQTVCGTGIRISELASITVEAVRRGEATVRCKGKTRTVFLVPKLQRKLLKYAQRRRIYSGAIFVTKTGRLLDRTNVWREMKSLCRSAGVSPEKVFPHNLRHLFARSFYAVEKDIAKLADVLGHSSVNTTRIYIVTTGAEHRRYMENLHLIL